MADTARVALNLAVLGMKDSILGLSKVYQMDKEQRAALATQPVKEEPQSTLARRRAERAGKHKATDTKKGPEPRILQRILLCCAWNGG